MTAFRVFYCKLYLFNPVFGLFRALGLRMLACMTECETQGYKVKRFSTIAMLNVSSIYIHPPGVKITFVCL